MAKILRLGIKNEWILFVLLSTFFVTLRLCLEDRRHLGNKNENRFILYFARFR